jgi:hypothetical protein
MEGKGQIHTSQWETSVGKSKVMHLFKQGRLWERVSILKMEMQKRWYLLRNITTIYPAGP